MPTARVLLVYEPDSSGRAALCEALDIARRAHALLTVVTVATKEPTNVGCARCRSSAAMWNREMRAIAEESLAEAQSLVGRSPTIDYALVVGPSAQAIAQAADLADADVVVLPSQRHGWLGRRFSSTLADKLRASERWRVVVATATPPSQGGGSQSDPCPRLTTERAPR